MNAFDAYFHPDYAIPSEFKEAFPAGRFRPLCKIQAKRGSTAAVVAESIKPPEWWSSTKVIQAFDTVLQNKVAQFTIFIPLTLDLISVFAVSLRSRLYSGGSLLLAPLNECLSSPLLNNLPNTRSAVGQWPSSMRETTWRPRLVD